MGYYDWANHRQLVKQGRRARRVQLADRFAMQQEARAWMADQNRAAAPGWYPDPADPNLLWWWDGRAWDGRKARVET